MTFNTGNNVPSTDPRDLYDNAENLDKLVNGVDPFYADRKGVLRQSWAGMENDFDTAQEGRATAFDLAQVDKESRFQAFLVSSGYVSKGDYASGVVLAERNEYVAVDATTTGTTAALYRPGPGATLPLTLTGVWATDSANLVLLGDDVLRQELAQDGGSAMIGYAEGTVAQALDQLSADIDSLSGSIVVANVSATATPAENTAALQAQAAASEGMTLTFPAGVFEFDAITLTTNVRMSGQGAATVLRLADGSGGHLLTSSANLVLTDLVLDQNRQNNPDRMKSAISFSGTDLYARNVSFKNTMFAGVHVPNVATEKLTLIDCDFESMAEHSGTMGEQTQAVNCRVTGACKVVIRGGNVTHGVPADVDAAPGGFIFDGAGIQSVEVSGVTFRNIGQRKASNFIGAIDLYTNCRDVTVHGNKVFNYYYVPFKFQNCLRVVMTGNIVNGVADAVANQAVVFQNARDHQAAVVEFTCTGNVLIGTSQLTDAIYVQGDPDRIFDTERVTISGNVIRAFRYGINTSYVKGASMSCNDISLSVDGIYIRDVINGSTFSISGGRIANSSSRGIAAIGATGFQLNLTVSGVTLEANNSFHVDANFAARLTVAGCNLIGSPTNDIRSQNNGMAVVTGNNNGSATASLSILTGTTKQAGNSWN